MEWWVLAVVKRRTMVAAILGSIFLHGCFCFFFGFSSAPFANSLATLYKVALLQISEKKGTSSRAERPARSWDMIRARCSVVSMVKRKQNWIFVRFAKMKVRED